MFHRLLRLYSTAWVAAVALLLTSCGPSYFLAMQPTRANGPSVNGHPTTLSQHPEDSVQVRMGFVRYEDAELVFEVAVSNESGRPVVLDPATFYYMPRDTAAPPPAATPRRIAAIDPEARLKLLAARLDEEAKKAEKVSFLEILTSVSHVAEDVSSIKKKETQQQIAERKQRHKDDNDFYDSQRAEHAQEADKLYDQQQNLTSVALRKTTVAPGEVAVGQVHFPRSDEAKQLRVVVFYNERPVEFDFLQKYETYQQAHAQNLPLQ